MEEEYLYIPEVLPVYPLAHLVLFPHMILTVPVEEQDRDMFLPPESGTRVVGAALLKPARGLTGDLRRAPVYRTLGLGQVLRAEEAAGGNANVLLRGIGRAVIVDELPDGSYRQARIEPVQTFCSGDEGRTVKLRNQLFAAIRGNPALDPQLRKYWLKLRRAELDLDALADLLAAGVPVEPELQQLLLDEADAFERAKLLLQQVRTLGAVARVQLRIPKLDEYNLN